ncbi:hypothetical protein [Delftia acidovorans]|uniref:hypothetical protein n=1 Tax=Delftia acidovorans TaxID=80866 RepID=UPI0028AB23CA|nr:hypothetical protein [Delftia acidovorans]
MVPQAAVTGEGFKTEIDGEGWLVKSVEHTLGDGEFATQIELERQSDGNAREQEDVEDPVIAPRRIKVQLSYINYFY